MRFRGRRLPGFSGVMLVSALAGLLVMHGFDAGAATGGGDGHAVSPTVQLDIAPSPGVASGAMPDTADSGPATSTEDAAHMRVPGAAAAAGHAGLGHVAAMCMVVAAAASTGVVRRILRGVRATFAVVADRAAGRPAWAAEAGRPPGPGRLELCILRC